MVRAFIAVGSNIQPEENVRAALHALAKYFGDLKTSTVYLSEAEDRPEQPSFYNCVVEIETDVDPMDLKFRVLRPIEEELLRRRTSDKYAPRTIDLDLIIYGNTVLNSTELVLPDPEISRRAFLSIPLAELAPDLIVPGTVTSISSVAAAFSKEAIEPLHSYTAILRDGINSIKDAKNRRH